MKREEATAQRDQQQQLLRQQRFREMVQQSMLVLLNKLLQPIMTLQPNPQVSQVNEHSCAIFYDILAPLEEMEYNDIVKLVQTYGSAHAIDLHYKYTDTGKRPAGDASSFTKHNYVFTLKGGAGRFKEAMLELLEKYDEDDDDDLDELRTIPLIQDLHTMAKSSLIKKFRSNIQEAMIEFFNDMGLK